MKALGLRAGGWFVCLHVRETGFWKEGISSVDKPRCANITNYKLAIQAVLDAGGAVVRMGDPSMTPLEFWPGVIDYAHSVVRSDWLDVYLAASCRFMMATNSGVIWMAKLFGRPVLGSDWLPM